MGITKAIIKENSQMILDSIQGIDKENSIVYVAGSILEGFGNECSDVDVYIIYDPEKNKIIDGVKSKDGATIITDKCVIHNFVVNNLRYDCEYWSFENLKYAIELINGIDFNTEEHLPIIKNDIFDLIHRIKYGMPIANQDKFYEFFNSIKFENLGYYKVAECTSFYSARLEDIKGALASKDFGTAFFLTRMTLDHVVSAYLAVNGETNPSLKWLYRKLVRFEDTLEDSTLINKYIEFQNYPFDENTVEKFVKSVIRFCQKLIMDAQNILNKKQRNY